MTFKYHIILTPVFKFYILLRNYIIPVVHFLVSVLFLLNIVFVLDIWVYITPLLVAVSVINSVSRPNSNCVLISPSFAISDWGYPTARKGKAPWRTTILHVSILCYQSDLNDAYLFVYKQVVITEMSISSCRKQPNILISIFTFIPPRCLQ